MAASKDLALTQGKTFTLALRWETIPHPLPPGHRHRAECTGAAVTALLAGKVTVSKEVTT